MVVCYTPDPERLREWRLLIKADHLPGCVGAIDFSDALDSAIRSKLPAIFEIAVGREMVRDLSLLGKVVHLLSQPVVLLAEEAELVRTEMRTIPQAHQERVMLHGDPSQPVQFLRALRHLFPRNDSCVKIQAPAKSKRPTARLSMCNGVYRLEKINLCELVRLCFLHRRSGVLNVTSQMGEAALFFERGRPTHVEQGEVRGLNAFEQVRQWNEGIARWEPLPPGEPTFERSMTHEQIDQVLGVPS